MNTSAPARPRPAWRGRLFGLVVALVGPPPFAAQAACTIQTVELPVQMSGTRAIATVGINGHTVPLMVDSGAAYSFLTEAAAAQLELSTRRAPDNIKFMGLNGRVDIRVATVGHLQLLKGDISNVEFAVGGNELGQGAMGILGRNLLTVADTEFDLAHGMIRLVTPDAECKKANMAYWAAGAPVSTLEAIPDWHLKLPAIRASAQLDGTRVDVLFDTGASTVVSLRAAERAGVKRAELRPDGTLYGAGRGKTDAFTATFDRFEIGNEAILHNRLPVADFDAEGADMLLGIDFFLSHRIYVSRQQDRIFFTYNGGRVFARNTAERAGDAASAAGSGEVPDKSADPLDASGYARRGAASRARGDLDAALADLDRACALDPQNAGFFADRARVRQALKQPAAALEDFDTAVRLDPGRADARLERAAMRAARGHDDSVLDDLTFLDGTLAPQDQKRQALAQLFGRLHLPARALPQWDLWIAAHPHDILLDAAYNARCWSRAELGTDLQKALDDCDKAVDADAKSARYLNSRGWVYLGLGQWSKALADFTRAVEISPTSAWALYGRGVSRQRMGDAAAGEADLGAARRLRPDIDTALTREGLPREAMP